MPYQKLKPTTRIRIAQDSFKVWQILSAILNFDWFKWHDNRYLAISLRTHNWWINMFRKNLGRMTHLQTSISLVKVSTTEKLIVIPQTHTYFPCVPFFCDWNSHGLNLEWDTVPYLVQFIFGYWLGILGLKKTLELHISAASWYVSGPGLFENGLGSAVTYVFCDSCELSEKLLNFRKLT